MNEGKSSQGYITELILTVSNQASVVAGEPSMEPKERRIFCPRNGRGGYLIQ